MFAKSIVLSDAFLDMPMSARCLYFTLGMLADDDGFVSSPKSIMRQCGATQDDLMVLLTKRFVLGFESGVIVIKHWRINNYLKNDRHHPTTYQEELDSLMIDQKGAYTEREKELDPPCIQLGSNLDTTCIQDGDIGKNSLDKNRLDKISLGKASPTLEEVQAYAQEIGSHVDPERFWNYYNEKNWMTGNEPVNDWKAIFQKWSNTERPKKYTTAAEYHPPSKINTDQLEKIKTLFGSNSDGE